MTAASGAVGPWGESSSPATTASAATHKKKKIIRVKPVGDEMKMGRGVEEIICIS